ncbi:MAG: hypothetical protein BGO97_08600 [Micrococcales bacterium 70-64]|nr:hypothetical protein [Leifsonia sp.]ODU64086.1 MAG: hypothetical protein ABT06_08605 [Leifsonia sp. SCN 70-46]OJX85777.1 MAG: hypothetical protein BGO97_08600 [Micrococcales bacterium 70-64]
MSPEPAFAPLSFPALPGQADSAAVERESIRGHAAGYAAGRRQADAEIAELRESLRAEAAHVRSAARAEIQAALDALDRAAAEFRSRQIPALLSVDASIAAAALELAETIVGRELATGEGSARAALERASLEPIPAGSTVRLNPQDIAVIVADGAPSAGLELVPDFSLERGDAVVDLAHGTLDARVSASLQRARTALAEGAA